MPILRRSLNDRNTDTKSKASKVVGNMCRLTEHKDLKPYLGGLMENIQTVLVDPIPSTRAIAAKAVGSLVAGMGEEEFPSLVQWLLTTMQTNSGLIERSVAAQGLASVVGSLPEYRFSEDLLPQLIESASSDRAHVRQGALAFFQFLPESWGMPFARYLSLVLPSIVRGLADETEFVREAALKAGQAIVGTFSRSATDLLLPTLEEGIFDNNWRIRQSSIELLGEFLHKVTKTTAKEVKDISDVIGNERGSSVLAALYLIRSDTNALVQQSAVSTWKSVVTNTPKTLRAILPVLMKSIISSLASKNNEKRSLASQSLGDIVKKLGERVLSKIVPILEKGLESEDPSIREAVCLGLSEVMGAAARHQINDYLDNLMPAIRRALSDVSGEVQEAGAKAFDVLYDTIGFRAIDEIIPPLINNLEDPDPEVSHKALNGLSQMLSVRSNIVLPFVIPKLVKAPMTLFNAKALASVVEVSGSALYPYLNIILPAFFDCIYDDGFVENTYFMDAAKRIVAAIQQDGRYILVGELVRSAHAEKSKERLGATVLLGHFASSGTSLDQGTMATDIISCLLSLFNDYSPEVQKVALAAMDVVQDKVDKEKAVNYIVDMNITLDILAREVRSRVTLGRVDVEVLPGFCLQNGLEPVLPFYLNSLRVGTPTIREQALEGIRHILNLTSTEALKNYIVKIIGPLIRIFTEKTLATSVKCSIIKTLNVLMDKGGAGLRVAVTQLQTTYVKAISDSSREVREEAAPGLGRLLNFGARVDFILKELLRILGTTSGLSAVAVLQAVLSLLENLPDSQPPKPDTVASLQKELFTYLGDADETLRSAAAICFGPFAKLLPEATDFADLMDHLMVPPDDDWRLAHGGLLSLEAILMKSPECFQSCKRTLAGHLTEVVQNDKVPVRQGVAKVIAVVLKSRASRSDEGMEKELVGVLVQLLDDTSNDVKVTALQVVKNTSKVAHEVFIPVLSQLVPIVLAHAKDKKVVRVKFAAERTLLHLLQLYRDNSVAKIYAKSVDVAKGKELSEFCKKFLSKLEPSDDEGYTAYLDE